jgi:small-conductance mechanosensitive channel
MAAMNAFFDKIEPYLIDYGAPISAVSIVMFIASVIWIPRFIASLPKDYFIKPRQTLAEEWHAGHTKKVIVRLAKNICGWTLLVLGVLMLILPGQGLLTILVGTILCDFPRKHAIERRLLEVKSVRSSANWLRKRQGSEPFIH